jgi:hypothetical protein
VTKGTRLRARWVEARTVSLAGVQPKVEGTPREVVGTVRHVRGDHPTAPTTIRLYVEPDEPAEGEACPKCGVVEIEVNPAHVVEILP